MVKKVNEALDLVHRKHTPDGRKDYKKFKQRLPYNRFYDDENDTYLEQNCKDMIMSILANEGDFNMSYNDAWDLIMNHPYMKDIIDEMGFDAVSDIADIMILNFVDDPDVPLDESYDHSEEIARKYFVSLNKEKERGYTRYFILNDGYFVKDIIADSDKEAKQKFYQLLSNCDDVWDLMG